MGRSKYCSKEQRNFIKKLIGEEKKTYKDVPQIIGCSTKMISNSFKMATKKRNTVEENEQLLLKRIGE